MIQRNIRHRPTELDSTRQTGFLTIIYTKMVVAYPLRTRDSTYRVNIIGRAMGNTIILCPMTPEKSRILLWIKAISCEDKMNPIHFMLGLYVHIISYPLFYMEELKQYACNLIGTKYDVLKKHPSADWYCIQCTSISWVISFVSLINPETRHEIAII